MRAHGAQRFGADDGKADNHHQRAGDPARRQRLLQHQARQQQAAERRA